MGGTGARCQKRKVGVRAGCKERGVPRGREGGGGVQLVSAISPKHSSSGRADSHLFFHFVHGGTYMLHQRDLYHCRVFENAQDFFCIMEQS